MITVMFTWVRSPSADVDSQQVLIADAVGNVLLDKLVSPDVTGVDCKVPEGSTIIGSVTTIRGNEQVSVQSEPFDVGYEPLQPASNLAFSLVGETLRV